MSARGIDGGRAAAFGRGSLRESHTVIRAAVLPLPKSHPPMSVEELPLAPQLTETGSIIIAGPPMSGKYELMHRIFGARSDHALVLSTGHDADAVRDDYESITDNSGDAVGVIDCVSSEQGADLEDTEYTKYVSSPKNLTDLGVKFTELTDAMAADDPVVGLHSLSQLLMYWEADRIYQFTRVLLGQTQNEGWPTVAVINATMHDEQTIHTLLDPFDTVVDTRTEDEGREMRIRGRLSSPTPWQQF